MGERRESAASDGVAGDIVRDTNVSNHALAIVEKYETLVLNSLYKILQNCPRKHGVARDAMLAVLLAQPELFYIGAKSRQVSRLYAADANLATLRFWLRFMVHPDRKIITQHQKQVAERGLAEVGKMLGAWIKTVKGEG